VFERLTQLQRPTILCRFDVIGDEIADTALPLARAADTFLALRPNGPSNEPVDEIAEVLIAECRRLDANLLVMGSYGCSRLHELLPGSTTDRILRRSPLPLLIAH
jgi:nucleotide-binding universal stress UspA family protein